jgi:hypothetical protein
MTEPTSYAAQVIAFGLVRTREGNLRCPDAERLPVGSHLLIEIHSGSEGEYAVAVGAGSAVRFDNTGLTGNPWTGRDRWSM